MNLSLPNTDLLSELLRFLDTKSAVKFLQCNKELYINRYLIEKRIVKDKLNDLLINTLIPKQKYFSGIRGRLREWQLYLPHKYEVNAKCIVDDVNSKGSTSPKYFHKTFKVSNYVDTIPYRADIIHGVVFYEYFDEIQISYNHKCILTKVYSNHVELNLPTDKLSKFKLLYVKCYKRVKEILQEVPDVNFRIIYGFIDQYRRDYINRPGCIDIRIEGEQFVITTDGILCKI